MIRKEAATVKLPTRSRISWVFIIYVCVLGQLRMVDVVVMQYVIHLVW